MRHKILAGLLAPIALAAAGAVAVPPAARGDASLPIPSGNGYFNVGVTSFKAQRFEGVVRQQFDFSCGSAAIATLLTYHYGRRVSELDVFRAMYARGDKEKIHAEGFSLLDMKQYLNDQGLAAEGFRVELDKLLEANIPAVVLINTKGYMHFVVVKGVRDGKVLVADPALGNRIISRDDFEAVWNGLLFVVLDDTEVAQAFFNANEQWRIRPKAPVGSHRTGASVGSFTLNIPGRNFF